MVEPEQGAASVSGVAIAEPAPPRLRGVLHQVGFVVACVVGAVFLGTVDGRRLVAAAVFATSAVLMLGASTL